MLTINLSPSPLCLRLHEGLGRQISRIIQVIQISLVARHALVVAVVRVDLVQEPRLEVHYCWLSSHIANQNRVRTGSGAGPTRPGPNNFSPNPR